MRMQALEVVKLLGRNGGLMGRLSSRKGVLSLFLDASVTAVVLSVFLWLAVFPSAIVPPAL